MNKSTTFLPNIEAHAFRLKPGNDLKKELQAFIEQNLPGAAWISSAAGSLKSYRIRFADQSGAAEGTGHFEIVSLSGTLCADGMHVHISISDHTGKTIGGHLLEGCIIYTTAEIVILSTDKYVFKREMDGTTNWPELRVLPRMHE